MLPDVVEEPDETDSSTAQAAVLAADAELAAVDREIEAEKERQAAAATASSHLLSIFLMGTFQDPKFIWDLKANPRGLCGVSNSNFYNCGWAVGPPPPLAIGSSYAVVFFTLISF